jgi:membrane protein DedA with SNARE-associated domain
MLTALSTTIIHLIQSIGYFGIFILMTLDSMLIPIPSEITMPFAGFLASQGTLSLPLVILMGALGNVIGSLVGYYIGSVLEEKALLSLIKSYGKYLLISEKDYIQSEKWFKKYGNGIVFLARLMPGIRTFISLAAGMFEMEIKRFIFYTFLGCVLWSGVLTCIGFYLGKKWENLGPLFNKFQDVILVLLILAIGYFIYHKIYKSKKDHSI